MWSVLGLSIAGIGFYNVVGYIFTGIYMLHFHLILFIFELSFRILFVAAIFVTHKLFDLFGGSSFVLTAWLVSMLISQTLTLRQWLLVGLVTAYGLRLSGYLFSRILNSHSDSRFDPYFIHEGEAWMTAPKYYPFKLSILWIMQIMWVFVVQLPVSIVLGKAADSNRMAMQWYDWCFIVAAILGTSGFQPCLCVHWYI
jgi:steroid 5-alpha reductase family enzyme